MGKDKFLAHRKDAGQVALIPEGRKNKALSRKSVGQSVLRTSSFAPLQKLRDFFVENIDFSSKSSASDSLTQPYYYCPLCHHQFSSANVGSASFAYPQAAYFRNLVGDSGAERAQTHSFGYYAAYFAEIRKLSRGRYGAVYVCQHILNGVPLGLFAVKKIPVGDDATYLTKVLREVRILENMAKHPNVVEYNHSWIDTARTADFGPYTRCLFILMEFATEGSLDDYLSRHGAALSPMLVWYFFLSAVAGVNHLHHRNILHCDIKPQNLLLTAMGDGLPRLMVSDFGASCLEHIAQGASPVRGCTGTEEYMAPELFEGSEASPAHTYRYSKASDMWSLGVVLHFLMSGGHLPSFDRAAGTMRMHAKVSHRPPDMIALLERLLSESPSRRPSCDDILASETVQNLRKEMMRDFSTHDSRSHSPHFVFARTGSEGSENSDGRTPSSLPSPSLQPQLVYAASAEKYTLDSHARDDNLETAPCIQSAASRALERLVDLALFEVSLPAGALALLFGMAYAFL